MNAEASASRGLSAAGFHAHPGGRGLARDRVKPAGGVPRDITLARSAADLDGRCWG
jgi:hypothetical protein